MKRRNADCGKIRRPLKRTKISEGIYGSTFLYVKFLVVWALVLLADFILEFRFEYLWPFWLLLRSVYDSFKYQGLAFSVFFVFIAFTSDMICFFFIPVHWLFFAASTYVWVQYVWHTERLTYISPTLQHLMRKHLVIKEIKRGICLPTISLWLLFVYIEASVRLKELKNMPFHLDLCRPFAAHCIGYPVVTLGFGFKSYVGYRLRLRKQKEVAKENEFYVQLLHQALPVEAPSIATVSPPDKASKVTEEVISNGHCVTANHSHGRKSICSGSNHSNSHNHSTALAPVVSPNKNAYSELDSRESRKQCNNTHAIDKQDYQCMEAQLSKRTINDFDDSDESCEREKPPCKSNGIICVTQSSGTQGKGSNHKWGHSNSVKDNLHASHSSKRNRNSAKEITSNHINSPKDEHTHKLEADLKRLRADLQSSRQSEQDLRSQIHAITAGERCTRNELLQLQQDNENLQNKLHNVMSARQQDKQTISQLEKKVQEEKKTRILYETQLAAERKAKKADEAAAARAVAAAAARTECTENCKSRRRDLDNEVKQLRRDLKLREDKIQQMERQAQVSMTSFQENIGSTQALVSALNAMEEKNARLENSLSAETRLKLDLFSALGEAKRQLEIAQSMMGQKDKEIDELKSKIAEVMAVMPVSSSPNCYSQNPPAISLASGIVSSLLYSPKYMGEEKIAKSNLDPNASVYTPKVVPSDI